MRYIDEFRDGRLAKKISEAIERATQPGRTYRFMEFCGGHTHTLFRYGVPDLLPLSVEMNHGPGCPVCVMPSNRLDMAITLAETQDVILCTYGDMLRVPASHRQTLMQARADGADVRMVYSTTDALRIAQDNPDRQVVFFAVGFETTTPPTAIAVIQAKALGLRNFTIYCNHVLTPPAMKHLLAAEAAGAPALDGFVGPGHVSTVIGSTPYDFVAADHDRPVVISGFEPLDMMHAILMLVRQVNDGRAEVENQYGRAVTPNGNAKAKAMMDDVFVVRPTFPWRGLGDVPDSALAVDERYAEFDAEQRFAMTAEEGHDNPACDCPSVLCGSKKPTDCKLFATVCTPENPIGACMVSSEGACAAYYTYGRSRDRVLTA